MLDGASNESSAITNPVYGKYQGTVMNNLDPQGLGQLQAFVPRLLGGVPTGWAKPCVPYGGPTSGFFSVPPIGAGVWIEFECGDVSQPIWTGCYWGAAELPMKPPGSPAQPTTRIWRTETGLTVVMDDVAQTITLTDGLTLNSVEVSVATGTVTIKGAVQVVSSAPLVKHGSIASAHPAVLGDQLFAFLTQLVTIFNSHLHPGELALGILPVTPAPPVAPMPLPSPQPALSQSAAGVDSMGTTLKAGNLTASTNPNDPAFLDSMAQDIEDALEKLMTDDGLPPLSKDASDQSVRDRRRFIVAIARGVVKHLADNPGAFAIVTNSGTVTAQLDHITTV